MRTELDDSFFIRFGKRFSAPQSETHTDIPFQDHPQFPMLVDILSRKEKHHVFLCADFSAAMHAFLLEALSLYFTQPHIPAPLHEAELIYLNLEHAVFTSDNQLNLERDFLALRQILQHESKYMLFAMPAELILADSTPPLLRAIRRFDDASAMPFSALTNPQQTQTTAAQRQPCFSLLSFHKPDDKPSWRY